MSTNVFEEIGRFGQVPKVAGSFNATIGTKDQHTIMNARDVCAQTKNVRNITLQNLSIVSPGDASGTKIIIGSKDTCKIVLKGCTFDTPLRYLLCARNIEVGGDSGMPVPSVCDAVTFSADHRPVGMVSVIFDQRKDKLFGGSGGSNNIIIVKPDVVLKIIPFQYKRVYERERDNSDQKEIEFFKLFSDELVKTNKTPHIVTIRGHAKFQASDILPNDQLTYGDILEKNLEPPLENMYKLKFLIEKGLCDKTWDVLFLEKASTGIETEIVKILSKGDPDKKCQELCDFMYRSIFQFLFTYAVIKAHYPDFSHNDLFLRNVLGVNISDFGEKDYVKYVFEDQTYYLSANGFCLKLNDFGDSILPSRIESSNNSMAEEDHPRSNIGPVNSVSDMFNFFHDYYHGQDLGHRSITTLLEENGADDGTRKRCRDLLGRFIDVDTIDRINGINKTRLDRTWKINDVPVLQKTVKSAKDYLKTADLWTKYSTIPDGCKVVVEYNAA